MEPVEDNIFDRPVQQRSFVQRMAARTKTTMLNLKSYNTISLLPKHFVRPDSGTWTRFGQDSSEFNKDSGDNIATQDSTVSSVSVDKETNINNGSSRKSSSGITTRLFPSRLRSPFNYAQRNRTFRVSRDQPPHFSETKLSSGSDEPPKYCLEENDNVFDDTNPSQVRLSRASSEISSIPDDCRKEAEWKSCIFDVEEEEHFSEGFWKEWKSQMSKMWVIFTGETTAHGYKRTMAPHRSRIGRYLWVMSVVCVTSIVMVLLYNMLVTQDFNSFSSSIKSQPHLTMAFPAVTICNLAPYDFSRINFQQIRNNSDADSQFLDQVSKLQNLETETNDSDILKLFNNFTTKDLHDFIGWRLDKFIKRCFWNNVAISCSDVFTRSLTTTQSCFTFNFDPNNLTYADRVGIFSGLGLLIDVGNNAIAKRVPTGLKILVHEPSEYPNSREEGMLVSPDTTTYVSVAKNEYIFLAKPYKAYGTEYCSDATSQVDDGEDGKTDHYYNYTGYSSCVAECRLRTILQKCKCVVYALDPEIPGVPYCRMDEYVTCYLPTLRQSLMQSPYQMVQCMCPLPCKKVEYLTQMSSSALQRTDGGIVYLEQTLFDSEDQPLDDTHTYVELRVFYKELFTHIEEHVELYTWLTIFGNVGGQLGLFTGASVLTVLEFLELSLLILWLLMHTGYRYFKVRRKPKATDLNGKWKQEIGKP